MDKIQQVKVALKIRPLNSKEKSNACTECLKIGEQNQVKIKKK